jgi:hypothetical protein
MLCRLPEPSLTILTRVLTEYIHETGWAGLATEIQKLTSRKFPKILQGTFQPSGIKVCIKENGMQVIEHDHIGMNPQSFVGMTIIQTGRDDLAGRFINEDWEPLNDCESYEVDTERGIDAIALRVEIIRLYSREKSFI